MQNDDLPSVDLQTNLNSELAKYDQVYQFKYFNCYASKFFTNIKKYKQMMCAYGFKLDGYVKCE